MNDPVVTAIDAQIAHLQGVRKSYLSNGMDMATGVATGPKAKRGRTLSAAGREAISLAQSKRWANGRSASTKNTKTTKGRNAATPSVGRRGASTRSRNNSAVAGTPNTPAANQMNDPAANLGTHETGSQVDPTTQM